MDTYRDVSIALRASSRVPRMLILFSSAPERADCMLPLVIGTSVVPPPFLVASLAPSVILLGCRTQDHRVVQLFTPPWSLSCTSCIDWKVIDLLQYWLCSHSPDDLGRLASTESLLLLRGKIFVALYALAVMP